MPGVISVNNLVQKFGKLTAVDGVSFDVKSGEIFAFLGPNGAGKTTTIKVLTTLLKPTSGEISICGHSVVTEQDAVRHCFGIVFQDPSLDDELTAYENMYFHAVMYRLPKEGRRERIESLLRFVDLWERRKDLVKRFSGGMKRRLEIARGLLHEPKVLFLDEPTLGLDPQTRNSIWERVRDMNQKRGTTVFFTTHYMEEAQRVADRIAVIDHGKIVSQGTVADLLRQTNTQTLEEAFLQLTGKHIREEEAGTADQMRMRHRLWRR